MTAYLPRTIEPVLAKAAREFPAVVLTGPRQCGKTTVLRRLFGDSHGYVSLEPPDVRAAATADPRGFLDLWRPPVILDEVQHVPGLLPYIQERIDSERAAKGRFLLSGSQNLLLMQRVSESLAGRAAVLRLFPLSWREREGRHQALPVWERRRAAAGGAPLTPDDFWKGALRGGYPELAAEPDRDPGLWYTSYVQTYLERDVRTLRQVGDLTQFQIFLRMLAARSAQLVNLTDLGRDLGLATNTVKAWVSVLVATHQIVILRPYFANVGKRLVKTPKIFFTDTGLLCHLAGVRDPVHASAGPMAGAIVETSVVMEVVKAFVHRGQEARLGFWRTATGDEVDLLVETGEGLIPMEVKSTATPLPGMIRGISRFRALMPAVASPGYVIHLGDRILPLGEGVLALPFNEL